MVVRRAKFWYPTLHPVNPFVVFGAPECAPFFLSIPASHMRPGRKTQTSNGNLRAARFTVLRGVPPTSRRALHHDLRQVRRAEPHTMAHSYGREDASSRPLTDRACAHPEQLRDRLRV